MSALVSLPTSRGISQSDVSHAADTLLRSGERPTIEKVRAKIGRGSPNTINPLLDAWWKTLATRFDAGPPAFHRLPEAVAHVAEALWLQAMEEARTWVRGEHKTAERRNAEKEQTLEVRSHVLTLREGELDARLRDRERTIEELNQRLRSLSGLLRKEQATGEWLARRLTPASPLRAVRGKTQSRKVKRTAATQKAKPNAGRSRVRQPSAKAKKLRKIDKRR